MAKHHYSTLPNYPKTADYEKYLTILGFDFSFDNPNKRHPRLIVKYYGRPLRAGVRFPVMKTVLRNVGLPIRPGLSDVAHIIAAKKYGWGK